MSEQELRDWLRAHLERLAADINALVDELFEAEVEAFLASFEHE